MQRVISARHRRRPRRPKADPVADLKAQLKAAVESEDYERAASLRDEIRRMEGEQKLSTFEIHGGFTGLAASSRVRLARNIKGYPFRLTEQAAQ